MWKKTAYHVIRMTRRNDEKHPSGIHGALPGFDNGTEVLGSFNGLKVVYNPQAVIKGSGYRLVATEIEEGLPVGLAMPYLNPSPIAEVIGDLERQNVRIGDRIRIKIEREILAKGNQKPVSCVQRFRLDENRKLIANYGFGVDDRTGIVIFGGQGVVAGDNLVTIFFHPNQRSGVALACPDHDRIDAVIRDLSEQHRLAEHYKEFGCLPQKDKPRGELARLFRQGRRNQEAQSAP